MPSKQQEFYNTLRQETETRVATYKEFHKQIEDIQASSKKRVADLKEDMKFIAKQIDTNNATLKSRGQEVVKFAKAIL